MLFFLGGGGGRGGEKGNRETIVDLEQRNVLISFELHLIYSYQKKKPGYCWEKDQARL